MQVYLDHKLPTASGFILILLFSGRAPESRTWGG